MVSMSLRMSIYKATSERLCVLKFFRDHVFKSKECIKNFVSNRSSRFVSYSIIPVQRSFVLDSLKIAQSLPRIPLETISFTTPSSPILSNLSKATVKSISLSLAPITSAIPDKIFLLLILITVFSNPNSEKTVSYNCKCIKINQILIGTCISGKNMNRYKPIKIIFD